MFFSTRIKSIRSSDKVLEVGPGNNPFYRSDVLLEKEFDTEEMAYNQAGKTKKKIIKKKIVYYDGEKFPFSDNEFNYVICSHVLEHVPIEEIPIFINELTRVAKKGYIEFPSYNFEIINNISVHVNLLNIDKKNKIYIMDKSLLDFNSDSYCFLQSFLKESLLSHKINSLNHERIAIGFEFFENIDFEVIDSLETMEKINKIESKAITTTVGFLYIINYFLKQFNKNILFQRIYNKYSKMRFL